MSHMFSFIFGIHRYEVLDEDPGDDEESVQK